MRWAIDGPPTTSSPVTGTATVAPRSPSSTAETGGVYRFDAWPHERIVTVPLVAQVEGATDLRVTHPGPPDCDVLTVDRADGPPTVLE